MANEKDRGVSFSRQVVDHITSHGYEHGERDGQAIRRIIQNPSPDAPGRYAARSVLQESDVEGFSSLMGHRVIGSYHEIEPSRWVPTSYFMVFLFIADKMLYLQDMDGDIIKRLGIPKYVEDDKQRRTAYQSMDLKFESVYEGEDGIVVRIKKGDDTVESLHAKFYALTPNPQMVRGEEKDKE
jgi:hypothetical protein